MVCEEVGSRQVESNGACEVAGSPSRVVGQRTERGKRAAAINAVRRWKRVLKEIGRWEGRGKWAERETGLSRASGSVCWRVEIKVCGRSDWLLVPLTCGRRR